jgi:hypothetical protein
MLMDYNIATAVFDLATTSAGSLLPYHLSQNIVSRQTSLSQDKQAAWASPANSFPNALSTTGGVSHLNI